MVGRIIGHYRIVEKLGSGGMGVVYKAEDTKLGRMVALKVLPPERVADPNRKRRFVQEARAASALNHPNIITIYDIDEAEGVHYIAMECVEGKTLDRLIARHGLRVNEALRYAVQMAAALAKAHSAGIVQRDLKPTNVMVTDDGLVKVLDFGLAKLTEAAPASDAETVATVEPTTEEGTIVGTVGYMSPEQAEGKAVDARSDIFSFGSVLYEMLTGARAFQGETKVSTIAAILREEPKPLSQVVEGLPREVERIVKRCLRKDPAHRFQHMDDLKVALEELKEESDSGELADTAAAVGAGLARPREGGLPRRSRGALPYMTARWALVVGGALTVLASLLLALNVGGLRDRLFPKPPPELKQRRLTTNSSENPVFSGAISPDGKYLAYSDSAGIHLKLIETGEERLLPKPSGVASDAALVVQDWFPDGTRLLATLWEAGDRPSVWVVSVLAENARRLRDDAVGWSVSPDGSHLAYTSGTGQNYQREIWVMSPQGESPERVLGLDENDRASFVQWSPDGRRVAYFKWHPAPERVECSIETCTLKGAERTVVVADRLLSSFCWIPQGYIVYSRLESLAAVDSNLWKIPVDSRTGKPEGGPTRVTNWAGFRIDSLKASADGMRISYAKTSYQAHAYVGELEAGGTRMKPPQRLTLGEATDLPTAWTGDGKFVMFLSDRSGSWGLYKQAIDGGTAQVLVTANVLRQVRLSPDGSWLLYLVMPKETGSSTPIRVMRMPVLGGPSQMVLEVKNESGLRCARAPATFCAVSERSPDGKLLTITGFDPLKGRGPVLKTIQTDPTVGYDWDLAPDGSKVAVHKAGEAEAHVRLLSLNGGNDREITVKGWGGLQTMDWSPDGKVLYCGSMSPEAATLLRIDMQGRAQVLWRQKGAIQTWGVPSPDGRRLAIMGYIINSNQWMVEGF